MKIYSIADSWTNFKNEVLAKLPDDDFGFQYLSDENAIGEIHFGFNNVQVIELLESLYKESFKEVTNIRPLFETEFSYTGDETIFDV